MAHDPISEYVWAKHEAFHERRFYRDKERARWLPHEWRLLYLLTEARYDQESGMYVCSLARSSWDVDMLAARRRLGL